MQYTVSSVALTSIIAWKTVFMIQQYQYFPRSRFPFVGKIFSFLLSGELLTDFCWQMLDSGIHSHFVKNSHTWICLHVYLWKFLISSNILLSLLKTGKQVANTNSWSYFTACAIWRTEPVISPKIKKLKEIHPLSHMFCFIFTCSLYQITQRVL